MVSAFSTETCSTTASSRIMVRLIQMDLSDAILILFVFIVVWLAIELSDGGGGGHRARVPAIG